MKYPAKMISEVELEEFLSIPSAELVEMMKRISGDIMLLGIAGKMGITMGRRAVNAIKIAAVNKKVYGVARFSDKNAKAKLNNWGIETISCDLLNREAVQALPSVDNVIFMAGRKFGTDGSEDITWAMNTIVPANVVEHFKNSRIVAFSTGCVYPLMSATEGPCDESVSPVPVGEYSQSCLGRERIFQFGSKTYGTKILLFRLNYAIDLRYGVLHDIALQIKNGEKVNNTVGHFNVIWQGDANDFALRSLEYCTSPATILNVTGPETATINSIATQLAKSMNTSFEFASTPSDKCYLNDAAKMAKLFGYPQISLAQMIEWQAQWFNHDGSSLGKPTHFEVNNGKF